VKIGAAVLEEFGAPLAVQELELAEPKAGEVLVRLVACGVCHTDLTQRRAPTHPGTHRRCWDTKVRVSSSASARA
jgi:Zn-dependent alcohol dehydrogenase